jgi:hypothetical protein
MALFSNNISRLFENNPVNQVGPTGQPLIGGSNITDLGARSIGGLLGREVRGRPEQLSAALSQIDPKAPDAQQQQLAILIELGNPQQQVMAAQQLRQLGENEKTKAQTQRFRTSLISRNEALGGSENRTATIADATPNMLLDIRKEILDEERAAVVKNSGKAGRNIIGGLAGLPKEEVKKLSGLSDDQFNDVISGLEADDEAFTDANGNVVVKRVLKNFGKVEEIQEDGSTKWVTAESIDLLPAPTLTKDVGRANQLSVELTKNGVKRFTEVTDAAQTAYRTLAVNEDRLKTIDAGVIAGGELAELTTSALITLAASVGVELDGTEDAQRAQLLVAQGVEAVGSLITLFGAGTGLSNADREYAAMGAGGTLKLTVENIRELIKTANRKARDQIKLHETIYNNLQRDNASPASLSLYKVVPDMGDDDLAPFYQDL